MAKAVVKQWTVDRLVGCNCVGELEDAGERVFQERYGPPQTIHGVEPLWNAMRTASPSRRIAAKRRRFDCVRDLTNLDGRVSKERYGPSQIDHGRAPG